MKFLVPEPKDFSPKSKLKAFTERPKKEKGAPAALDKEPAGSRKNRAPIEPPLPPKTLDGLGFQRVFLRDLVLKTLYRTNIELLSTLTQVMCVLPTVLSEVVEMARSQDLVQTVGKTVDSDTNELRYQLTDAGRKRAEDALRQSEYYGAVPVRLDHFIDQANRQKVSNIFVSSEALTDSLKNLIISKTLLNYLGPAVNSGKSILLYGPPGNGKSSLANAIRDSIGDKIYVPRFLEFNGQIISMYDPVIHKEAETNLNDETALRQSGNQFDNRFVLVKRPCVITGGELMLEMLDLNYSTDAKIYQAPLQLKATGGVFIVEDLGRQQEPPQAMINRWITPMETGEDILSLATGEKFAVPFDCMTVFSTNFHPNELFDRAALRRIAHKILVEGPDRDQMLQIYLSYAKHVNMDFPEDVAIHLFAEKYPTVDNDYAAYHAKFLIDQIFSVAEYHDSNPEITVPMIDQAWQNLYVQDHDFDS